MRCPVPLLLAASLALAGCQTFPITGKPWTPDKFKPDLRCVAGMPCTTWVNPLNDWVPGLIDLEAQVDGKRDRQPRDVVWYSAWPFENGGIQFDAGGRKAFACERRSPWMVVCTSNPAVTGKFKYVIDVLGYDPVDPFVFNR